MSSSEWIPGYGHEAHYHLGDHITWRGIKLVCTRDHYSGFSAKHPWDPGASWPKEKAMTLWAPNGPVEAEKLSYLFSKEGILLR